MYDTTVTIVGNALNAPELRQTNGAGVNVASFRVASTSRRFDRDNGRWVDGPSLRVRVTCWRRLAESVQRSVFTGDPLIVTGRMYTRDWIADDGQHRVSYELEAVAVGHDLSRGQSTFTRFRPNNTTSAIEDAEADSRVRGEVSQPVTGNRPRDEGDQPDSFGDPVEGYGGGFGRDERGSYGATDAEEAFGVLTDDRSTAAEDAAEVFRAAGFTPEIAGAAERREPAGTVWTAGNGHVAAAAGRDAAGGRDTAASQDAVGHRDGAGTDTDRGGDGPAGGDESGPTRRRGRARVPQPV